MTRTGINDPLAEARRLAGENGYVIAEAIEERNPSSILDKQPYTVYILYRNRVRIGRRSNGSALLALLRLDLKTRLAPPAPPPVP